MIIPNIARNFYIIRKKIVIIITKTWIPGWCIAYENEYEKVDRRSHYKPCNKSYAGSFLSLCAAYGNHCTGADLQQ